MLSAACVYAQMPLLRCISSHYLGFILTTMSVLITTTDSLPGLKGWVKMPHPLGAKHGWVSYWMALEVRCEVFWTRKISREKPSPISETICMFSCRKIRISRCSIIIIIVIIIIAERRIGAEQEGHQRCRASHLLASHSGIYLQLQSVSYG